MRNWLVVGVVVGVVGSVVGGCSSSAPAGDYTTFCENLAQAECPPVASVCANLFQNVSPNGSQFVTWQNLNGGGGTLAPASGSANDQCNLVFAGTVPANGNCVTSYDCESPNVCGSNGSCGPSGAAKQAGEGCADPGDVCTTGTVCSLQGTHFLCSTGVPVGSSCSATNPCASSAECVKGKCKALSEEGGACTSDADCDQTAQNSGFCDTSLKSPICTAGYSFATEAPDCSGFKGTTLYTGG